MRKYPGGENFIVGVKKVVIILMLFVRIGDCLFDAKKIQRNVRLTID
jgi:hypothetical protein